MDILVNTYLKLVNRNNDCVVLVEDIWRLCFTFMELLRNNAMIRVELRKTVWQVHKSVDQPSALPCHGKDI